MARFGGQYSSYLQLRSGIHVPWSRATGPEVDDTDNRLLNDLALTLQVFSQDLGELWRYLTLRPRDL